MTAIYKKYCMKCLLSVWLWRQVDIFLTILTGWQTVYNITYYYNYQKIVIPVFCRMNLMIIKLSQPAYNFGCHSAYNAMKLL